MAPTLKPVTVVTNDVLSVALPEAGLGVPLVQLTLTLADPLPLSGMKSLFTVNVALRRVFTIVHWPALRSAEHVPLELYPVGIGDSVAVHVGSGV